MSTSNVKALIEIKHLKKYFPVKGFKARKKKQMLKAVDDVTFTIKKGETFGLVGESGCGKSTLGRMICRLYDVTDGEIIFDGTNIENLKSKALKPFQKRIQAIFQDPYSSLNPNMTVAEIIDEPLEIHTNFPKKDRLNMIKAILIKVGFKEEDMNKYPSEFSGGQRQRIGIARALAIQPDFILCDEAISALDVSIQAQVINLLEDLQKEFGLTYLFIAHDLSMVRHISDRVGVMYLGQLVEVSTSEELYKEPLHPYTKALLSAIPVADPDQKQDLGGDLIQGELPSPLDIGEGCRFRSRCPFAMDKCAKVAPELKKVDGERVVACHLY
ncbi:ATP-binding cassette domain-containing protein [Terrilactibacillus sp. BCM23-1]|uniref:ATP-binding cassette domain-containing protein n=1 Tax=Terrilactibacillus tamarindi TaxID=2599694 RepID=A0A6N8CQA2_9BACI|nr:oligopeptide/dipeptide ABC transporter ATP-binding protein [Terrilactibacillus tamarindi]MTT32379.1 ATP-binding cassette domain-containing protein [Terrilactibacillus tamarindi]